MIRTWCFPDRCSSCRRRRADDGASKGAQQQAGSHRRRLGPENVGSQPDQREAVLELGAIPATFRTDEDEGPLERRRRSALLRERSALASHVGNGEHAGHLG